MEVSSASEESPEEDEETLNSLYLKPLDGKHGLVEQDFTSLTDHEQSFKELPKVQAGSQRGGASLSAAFRSDMPPGRERDGPSHGAEDGPPQREDESERLDSPPAKQQAGRSSPPSRGASGTPRPLGGRRRSKVGGSHSSSLSSLGDITALEERNSKLQTGSSGVLSQVGLLL
ncbi:hypothetical protein EYF80_060310 [Liparis tanakae]|uniref:Uncharacterized protein n=1 Tax=Liparis tanakae TaxID=230148 RepID=A0A4Z2ELV2_9TELE|nr:hypothetical protein EYF80_060310 [Liparis tanakae]